MNNKKKYLLISDFKLISIILLFTILTLPYELNAKTALILKIYKNDSGLISHNNLNKIFINKLSNFFKVFTYEKIDDLVFKRFGGLCDSSECVGLIMKNSDTEAIFQLKIKTINDSTQITLIKSDKNKIQILDQFCNECNNEKFKENINFMIEGVLNNNYEGTIHNIPINLGYIKNDIKIKTLNNITKLNNFVNQIENSNGKNTLIEENESNNYILVSDEDLSKKITEDILIFSLSNNVVQEPFGFFLFQVSAFSKIISITVNGKNQIISPEKMQIRINLPYSLRPGENKFFISVKTQKGHKEKEFEIFLETEFVKKSLISEDPLKSIIIIESNRDNNYFSIASKNNRTISNKNSYTFLVNYLNKFDHDTKFNINGLLMSDHYQQNYLNEYSIILSQLSLNLIENFYKISSEIKFTIGFNYVSTLDDEFISNSRDPLFNYYKKYTNDDFLKLEIKYDYSKNSFYKIFLENRKKKNIEENNQSNNSLKIGYHFKWKSWDLIDNIIKTSYSRKSFLGKKYNFAEQFYYYKLTFPLFFLSINPFIKQSINVYSDPNINGEIEVTTFNNYGLEFRIPLSRIVMFSLIGKYQNKISNVSNPYEKILTTFKLMFIL